MGGAKVNFSLFGNPTLYQTPISTPLFGHLWYKPPEFLWGGGRSQTKMNLAYKFLRARLRGYPTIRAQGRTAPSPFLIGGKNTTSYLARKIEKIHKDSLLEKCLKYESNFKKVVIFNSFGLFSNKK
jgi:hypothetical protein